MNEPLELSRELSLPCIIIIIITTRIYCSALYCLLYFGDVPKDRKDKATGRRDYHVETVPVYIWLPSIQVGLYMNIRNIFFWSVMSIYHGERKDT